MIKVLKNIRYFMFGLKLVSCQYFYFNLLVTILLSLNATINLVFFKIILDNIIQDNTFTSSTRLLFLFIFYLIISSFLKILLYDSYNPKQNILIQQNLQKIMFCKLKILDIACYENTEFYNKYVRAMNETENRFFQIFETIMQLVSGFFSAFSMTLLISTMHPVFIIFSILMVINSLYRGYKMGKYQYMLDKENTKNQREKSYVKRIFYLEQYIKEFKLFPLFDLCINIYDKAIFNITTITSKYYKKIEKVDIINMLLNVSIILIMILILCKKVITGIISVSDFMILFSSINNLSSSLTNIFTIFPNLSIHNLYIENLLEILNYEPQVMENISIPLNNKKLNFKSISFNNVSFKYNQKQVLSNISLSIVSGKKIAIVGRNGSGKSTFVKLLLRLYDPETGIIYWNNIDYKNLNTISLRSEFSVMFQDNNLYALTIGENILMEPVSTKKQENLVWEALKFSGLYNKIKKFKKGIYTVLSKEFEEDGIYLSGGEKQAIFIARAYASKGSILIFDEPSNCLDIIAEQKLFNKLQEIGNNKTTIFITHKLYTTINADIIYFFENGKIIESGSHSDLMKQNGKYKMMYDIQINRYNINIHI